MTLYAQALATIEREVESAKSSDLVFGDKGTEYSYYIRANISSWIALKAVLELHGAESYQLPAKFRGGEKGEYDTFQRCSGCMDGFPCPTANLIIRAVLDLTTTAKESA